MMWTSFELKIWSWTSLQPSPPLMHSKGDRYQRTRSSSPFPSFSPLPFLPGPSCHLPPPYAFSFLLCRKTNVGPIPQYPNGRNTRNIWPLHCHIPSFWGSHLLWVLLAYYKVASKSIIAQNVNMINSNFQNFCVFSNFPAWNHIVRRKGSEHLF